MTEKNQFWNHYLREQHKLFFLFFLFFHFTTISHGVIKSRTDDSIHSWSSASKVESRWHHWRCELVSAVFLDHLGFCNKMGNIFFNKIKTAENSCLLKIYCCPAMQLTQNNQVKSLSFYHDRYLDLLPLGSLYYLFVYACLLGPHEEGKESNQRKSGTNCLAIAVVHYQSCNGEEDPIYY